VERVIARIRDFFYRAVLASIYYEAVLRRWTKQTSIIKGIREDPLFVQLLKAKVTFLDDADFLGKTKLPPRPRGIPSLRRTIARAPIRALRTRVTPSYE